MYNLVTFVQGRIKASAGPCAVPNAGPYRPKTRLPLPPIADPQNCGPGCCSTLSTPLNAALLSLSRYNVVSN